MKGPNSQIVFQTDRDDSAEIYVMNRDGTVQTNLSNNSGVAGTMNFDGDPAVSPDGGKIACTTNRDGNLAVYVMSADGSTVTNLTNNAAFDVNPVWKP